MVSQEVYSLASEYLQNILGQLPNKDVAIVLSFEELVEVLITGDVVIGIDVRNYGYWLEEASISVPYHTASAYTLDKPLKNQLETILSDLGPKS